MGFPVLGTSRTSGLTDRTGLDGTLAIEVVGLGMRTVLPGWGRFRLLMWMCLSCGDYSTNEECLPIKDSM